MGKDIIRLEKEAVIPVLKHKLINVLSTHLNKADRDEFQKLCKRVEYTIRAWYLLHFEDLMQIYALFEPVYGPHRLQQQNLTPDDMDVLEELFIRHLFEVMEKSNFKIITDDEIDIALSAQYRLNLPIVVNEDKLDKRLLTRFFAKHPHDNLPSFSDKYLIFRRGFGIDHMTAYFINAKINAILARTWKFFLKITGIRRFLYGKKIKNPLQDVDFRTDSHSESLFIERIRIEKMRFSHLWNLLRKVTIQEPTFDRIIVVYRRTPGKKESGRNIYVKHFKNIPLADVEIVLPEKRNPGLTPFDWVKFLFSALIGLVTVISSLSHPSADLRVMLAILSTLIGYCVKTYFTFQRNLLDYQSLITRSVYNKQLDSGRGTLLHLSDEVIQQEVKEVILSYFILMRQIQALSKEELDHQSERFIKEEFGENCNFDIDDAVSKLKKLGIVLQDGRGCYTCVGLKEANDIIGTTTEEVVSRARQDGGERVIRKQKSDSESEDREEEIEEQEGKVHYAIDAVFDGLL